MTPGATRAMDLVDAARMYVAAIERDQQDWQKSILIANAMGAKIKPTDFYRDAGSPSRKRRISKKAWEQVKQRNADWIKN